jgi:hypothetical protein
MRDDVDRPVGIDADEEVRMQGRLVGVSAPVAGSLRPQQLGHGLRTEYEGPGSGQPDEEATAADVDDLAHARASAAALMAARIRWYVPQRQMFPAMEVSMSLSVGFGLVASRPAACMICPLWQ